MTNTNVADKISDQFRDMENKVYLAGQLIDVSNVRKGMDKNGNAYVSFKGTVNCSEDPANQVRFESYVNSYYTNKKQANPNYAYVMDLLQKYEDSQTDEKMGNGIQPVMVSMAGSYKDNPWYDAKKGKMHDIAVSRSMSFFNDFKKYNGYAKLEGYIKAIRDVENNKESTGEKIVTLVSKDGSGHIMVLEAYLSESDAEAFTKGDYEIGVTAVFRIEYVPIKHEEHRAPTGGFGKDPNESGPFVSVVPYIVGAAAIVDNAQIDARLIKKALAERDARVIEVKNNGIERARSGNASGSWGVSSNTASTMTSNSGFAGKNSEIPFNEENSNGDDDEQFF